MSLPPFNVPGPTHLALIREEKRVAAVAKLEPAPGCGKKVSVTDLFEGMPVIAPYPINGVGRWRANGRVSAGSRGVVASIMDDAIPVVAFQDAETGEIIEGDVYTWEIRHLRADQRTIVGEEA